MAFAIAIVAAVVFEWFAARTLIPPGGDEGTWLLLSFPYVGLPTPGQIQLFSYPPLSFPFLGLAVRATGNPLTGARLFVGVVIVALGLSAYELGRSLFQWRIVALFFEAALFLQPDFQQLYYFGAYPNLFGLVFFFLAVAFGLRFLRSRRDLHLALFWAAVTAAVLSHALVAVILLALLATAGLLLLAARRFPRELATSRVGQVGAAAFTGLSLLYYAGSAIAGTNPPNYLLTTVLTPAQSSQQLGEVFHAFYLEPLSVLVHAGAFQFSEVGALALLWGLCVLILVLLYALHHRNPAQPSDRVVTVGAWFLAVFGVALLSWYLGLTADYRRFTYFLYPADLLLIGVVADWALTRSLGLSPASPTSTPGPGISSDSWSGKLRAHRTQVMPAVVAITTAVLLLCAGLYTLPAANTYEAENSRVAHGVDLVNALDAIDRSSVSGAILSMTPVVDRWPATLTDRNLYEVRPPTGYTYTANNLVVDELASLSTNYRDAVTNGLVVAAVPGTGSAYFNATPLYGFYQDGILVPVFEVAPAAITVSYELGGLPWTWHYVAGAAGNVGPAVSGAGNSMEIAFGGSNVSILENVTAVPGTSELTFGISATALGGARLQGLAVNVSTAAIGSSASVSAGASAFQWSTTTTGSPVMTYGEVEAPATIAGSSENSTIALLSKSATSGGESSLQLAFVSLTPGASNTATGVSGFIDALALWQSWDVRFFLLWNGTESTGPAEQSYLEAEYGVTAYASDGPWSVLLLPPSIGV